MEELNSSDHDQIVAYAAAGDAYAAEGKYAEAQLCYAKAWSILPEPKLMWNAATWLLAARGDAAFLSVDYSAARQCFDTALSISSNVGNIFLHLRRGQVLFEQDEKDDAADELIRAYALAGPDIFETEDPKYLRFLASRADGIEVV